jgi:hypothetical protein
LSPAFEVAVSYFFVVRIDVLRKLITYSYYDIVVYDTVRSGMFLPTFRRKIFSLYFEDRGNTFLHNTDSQAPDYTIL